PTWPARPPPITPEVTPAGPALPAVWGIVSSAEPVLIQCRRVRVPVPRPPGPLRLTGSGSIQPCRHRENCLTQRKLRPQDVLANAIRQLLERGQKQGYLLYDEIYDTPPESVLDQPGELEDLYTRFSDEGVLVIDRPQLYHTPHAEEAEPDLATKEAETEVHAA